MTTPTAQFFDSQRTAGGDAIFEAQQLYGVLAKHTASYASILLVKHTAIYVLGGVLAKHRSSYGLMAPVLTGHTASYGLLDYDPVLVKHTATYAGIVLVPHTASYGLMGNVAVKHTTSYGLLDYDPVLVKHTAGYAGIVLTNHASSYGLMTDVAVSHTASYGLLDSVLAKHTASYALLSNNPILTRHRAIYALEDAVTAEVIAQSASVSVNGSTVQVQGWSVGMDEGDLGWQSSITLLRRSDAGLFNPGDAITLTVGSTDWSLQITEIDDPYSLDADGTPNADVTLTAVSPALYASGPYAETISATFETTTMAETAVETMLADSVDWQVLNWPITGGRLAIEKTSAMEAGARVLEAIGAVLESKPDGTLLARSLSPVAVPLLPTTTVDVTISTRLIYERNVQRGRVRSINRLDIIDVVPVYQDRLESEDDPDNWQFKTIRAYPSPWRTTVQVTHSHTRPPLYLYEQGEVTREITEEAVEFRDGAASVQYPIMQIVSSEWIKTDLGALSFEPYTTELQSAVAGNSLLAITYTTKSLNYRAYSASETYAQLLLEDTA